jgi:Transporter associated domain
VDFEGRRFTVLKMSDHRISQVRVERLENQTEDAERGSTRKAGTGARGNHRDTGKSES